jgi:Ran GTPase-activating protein (RanGAP) involved in mRNA processing and transport
MDPLIRQLVDRAKNNDPRLRHVSLRSLPLLEVTNEEIFAVIESLQDNTHVSTFDMCLHRGNNEGEEDVVAGELVALARPLPIVSSWIPPFDTILASNSSLVDIRISSSCSFILASVFRGLTYNKSVQILQVGEMSATGETTIMTSNCSQELQTMLIRNITIHRLALQGFRWENEEALQWLCSGLRANQALRVLELLQIVVGSTTTLQQITAIADDPERQAIAPAQLEGDATGATDSDLLTLPFDEESGYRSIQMVEAEAETLEMARISAATNLMAAIGAMAKLKRLCIIACEMADVASFASNTGLVNGKSDIRGIEQDTITTISGVDDGLDQQQPQLEELRLVDCELIGLGILKLQQGCRYTYPCLRVLDVRSNALEDDSCLALAEILHSATSLTKIILEDNNIGDEGLTSLCRKGLDGNSTLQQLCLKDNSFGPSGIKALCEVLRNNECLQKLDLSYNFVGDDGATALGVMLQQNTSLQDLVLENAGIGGKGVKGLCHGLQSSSMSSLRNLNLSGNTFGSTGVNALSNLLIIKGENGNRCSLTSLRLASCNLGDLGVSALASALEHNTRLAEIVLPFNRFGDEGALAIGQSLPKWQGLTSLQIQFNLFGEAGFQAIVKGLEHNFYLKSLYLLNAGPSNRSIDILFQEMQHWIRLNRAGRRTLHEEKCLPSKIWPFVLARAGKAYPADGIFFLLREQPGKNYVGQKAQGSDGIEETASILSS